MPIVRQKDVTSPICGIGTGSEKPGCHRKVSYAADCAAAQADVCAITDWTEERDLKMNVIKTKAMIVSRKRRSPVLEIKVGESLIERVSSYRSRYHYYFKPFVIAAYKPNLLQGQANNGFLAPPIPSG